MDDDPDIDDFEARGEAADRKIMESHLAQLCERFDSVQIVATRYCPQTGTSLHAAGDGNCYARMAAVDEWLRKTKRK